MLGVVDDVYFRRRVNSRLIVMFLGAELGPAALVADVSATCQSHSEHDQLIRSSE